MMSEKKKESATNTMKVRFIFTVLIPQLLEKDDVLGWLKYQVSERGKQLGGTQI
jgi:hypothetical protein